jgi:hypothetical protein
LSEIREPSTLPIFIFLRHALLKGFFFEIQTFSNVRGEDQSSTVDLLQVNKFHNIIVYFRYRYLYRNLGFENFQYRNIGIGSDIECPSAA